MAIVADRSHRPRRRLGIPRLTVCTLLLVGVGSTAAVEPAGKPAPSAASADATAAPQGIADLKALEAKIRETVAKVTPSVISVSGGSGVVINREGYVLTVAHVARQSGRNVVVIFPDGRRARAVTLGNDHGVDAGMVKITDKGPWPYADMGQSADLKPGHWCLTLGYPVTFEHGKPPLVRIGRVSSNRKTEIITDCTIMGGDSGAPLFNLDGSVIGIGTKCDSALAYNIHVPIDRFRDGWELLASGKDFDSLSPLWTSLGIFVAEEAAETTRIKTVAPKSGAEAAGVKPGDLLSKVGGKEFRSPGELRPLLRERKPGDPLEVEVRRGTETLKVQVTVGPAKN
jgi:serine protease Do